MADATGGRELRIRSDGTVEAEPLADNMSAMAQQIIDAVDLVHRAEGLPLPSDPLLALLWAAFQWHARYLEEHFDPTVPNVPH